MMPDEQLIKIDNFKRAEREFSKAILLIMKKSSFGVKMLKITVLKKYYITVK